MAPWLTCWSCGCRGSNPSEWLARAIQVRIGPGGLETPNARKGHRNKADKQLINVCYMIIIWCVVCYKYSESRAHQQEVPWLQHQSTYEPCLTVLRSVAPLAFVLWMNQKGLGPWNALVGTHGVPGTKMVPLEDIGSCKPPKISWVPSGNQRWWRIRHL
jgi:hypothetical protein